MSNVIYAHTEKRPKGKDTLVKDLGKKSQFSHTLKLAWFSHWQLAPIGATCSLTTSANAQLARVANWQQAPTPKNEKQRISPNQDQTHHFKQNLKQTQKQSTDQKKLLNKGKP